MKNLTERLSPLPLDSTLPMLLCVHVLYALSLGLSAKLALVFPAIYGALMLGLILAVALDSLHRREPAHLCSRLLALLLTLAPVLVHAWSRLTR